jgi:hypothetical protein
VPKAQNRRGSAAKRKDGMPVGRPFPKGVSGNPGGRPKTAKEIRELLQQREASVLDVLDYHLSRRNDRVALKLLEQLIGKAPQTIQLSGPGGGPIPVERKVDLSKLSGAELQQLEQLLRRGTPDARGGGSGTPAPEPARVDSVGDSGLRGALPPGAADQPAGENPERGAATPGSARASAARED